MEHAQRLARQLAAIEDPYLRARRARELLTSLPPPEAVTALAGLVRLADRRSDPVSAALEGALRALRELLDEDDRAVLVSDADGASR